MNRDDKNVFETLSSPVGVLVNEAQAIQFSFYTADELRKLSVVFGAFEFAVTLDDAHVYVVKKATS